MPLNSDYKNSNINKHKKSNSISLSSINLFFSISKFITRDF